MSEEQARDLFDHITSFAASDSATGVDVVVSIDIQGAHPSPAVEGLVHDSTAGSLSINTDPGQSNNCVPVGWDVIESVSIRVEPSFANANR